VPRKKKKKEFGLDTGGPDVAGGAGAASGTTSGATSGTGSELLIMY
jgi:hypothetical protein